MSHQSFGELLRSHRLRLGLTQEAVAERATLSVHAIQKLEYGTTHPYRDTTNRLVHALGLSAEDEAEFRELGQPAARRRNSKGTPPAEFQLTRPDLPVALTTFVGREDEIDQVAAIFGSARLITLTGVGGCGKTRLALEVARRSAAQFADGAVLIELALLTDGSLVPQAIGSTLGIHEGQSEGQSQQLLSTLCAVLRHRQMLLVLDNCEHLLEACARVADELLRGSPHLTILATSREALGLMGETSWRVPSLAMPPLDPVPPPEQLAEFAAVQLFVERAHAADAAFAITGRTAAAVAQVCSRLDGIPLALELAAVRVRGMAVDELAARLDQRFRLLTGGSRAALPRQQTLRATVDWSFQLLSPAERLVFRRLSVFASSWTLEAAETVCAGQGVEAGDVVELVLNLVDKSLVVLAEETTPRQRYALLQTLRQYGREQLVAADEADTVHEQHAAYFLGLAEHTEWAGSQLEASGWTDPRALVEADLDSALDWFVGQADTDRALRLASVLWHLWEVRGALTDGRRHLAAVLALPGADAPTLDRARVLNGAGVLALNQHDIGTARRLLRDSLVLYQQLLHEPGVAWVLIHLSSLCLDVGRLKAGRWFLRQALPRSEQLSDRRGIARCLNLLGIVAWGAGDLEASRDFHQRSLALSREIYDRWGMALSLHRLSVTLLSLAELGEADASAAVPLIEEGLTIWRELGERRHFAFALCDLATVAILKRDFAQAHRLLMESQSMFGQLGGVHGVRWAMAAQEFLLASAGDLESALRVLGADLILTSNRIPVPYRQRIDNQRRVAEELLDADVITTALTEGRAMSLPQALAYAERACAAAGT
jgi:non-specific serine/threonine protein kinase